MEPPGVPKTIVTQKMIRLGLQPLNEVNMHLNLPLQRPRKYYLWIDDGSGSRQVTVTRSIYERARIGEPIAVYTERLSTKAVLTILAWGTAITAVVALLYILCLV